MRRAKPKSTYYKVVPKIYRTDEYKDSGMNLYEVDEEDNILCLFIGAGEKIRNLQKHCTGFKTLREALD